MRPLSVAQATAEIAAQPTIKVGIQSVKVEIKGLEGLSMLSFSPFIPPSYVDIPFSGRNVEGM